MRLMFTALLALACAVPAVAQPFTGPPEFDLRVTNVWLYPSSSVKKGTIVTVRCAWIAEPWGLTRVYSPASFKISAWHRPPNASRETLKEVTHSIGKGEYAGPGYKGDAFTDALPEGELTATYTASGAGQHSLGCTLTAGAGMVEGKGNPAVATNENNNDKGAALQVIGTPTETAWPDDPTRVGLFILSPQRGSAIAAPFYLHIRRTTGRVMSKPTKGADLEWERVAGPLWLPDQVMAFAPWTKTQTGMYEAIAQIQGIKPGQWRVRARVGGGPATEWTNFTVK